MTSHAQQPLAPQSASDSFLRNPPSTANTWKELERRPSRQPVHPGSIPIDSPVTNLDFDVTENCNLGCVYCFKGEMYSRHMTLDTMKSTLEWLLKASGPAKSVNCNFMGGEPTMRFKQLKTFVPWARRRGKSVGKLVTFSMTTNLTLFTEEIREFVDQYGFGVLMSIDGCPDVQDAQRPAKNGKPQSETIAYWAKSMLRTRPRAQARATLQPEHVHRFFESVTYIHQLGFREMAVSASSYEKWQPEHFDVLEQQLDRVVRYILDILRCTGPTFSVTSFLYYIDKLIRLRREEREAEIEARPQPCGAGKGYLMVDYTGDIWPCHRFDGADTDAGAGGQFRLGNIFKEGVNYDLRKSFRDFDHFRDHKFSCNTCPVNKVCGGYCPAANLSTTGSIYTPHDAFCRWSQTMYAYSERLYDLAREAGETVLGKLIESAAGTAGTGEK